MATHTHTKAHTDTDTHAIADIYFLRPKRPPFFYQILYTKIRYTYTSYTLRAFKDPAPEFVTWSTALYLLVEAQRWLHLPHRAEQPPDNNTTGQTIKPLESTEQDKEMLELSS